MELINTANEEEKLQLLTEMQELYKELGRIPDRFDWYIYTQKRWSDFFTSWHDFLVQAGVIEKGRTISYRYKESEKLCQALRAMEAKLGRPVTPEDWNYEVCDECNRSRVWFKHFNISRFTKRNTPDKLRKLVEEYAGNRKFSFDCRNETAWLSFRFAAGLDQYTKEELIELGMKNLDKMEASGQWLIGAQFLADPSSAIKTIEDDWKIGTSFASDLPHFAIHRCFGTYESFVKEVCSCWIDKYRLTHQDEANSLSSHKEVSRVTVSIPKGNSKKSVTAIDSLCRTIEKLYESGALTEVIIKFES
jgi:hypothetical protein